MKNNLPADWKRISLGEYVENHDSARIPVSREERAKRKGKYPYYGASGIIDEIDGFTHEGEYLLLGEDGANLLARTKPIAFLAKGKVWVNNHAHVLKCKGEFPNAYLAFFLNSIDLAPYVTGTAQPKLSQSKMNTIPIPIAPLDQQKRIVAEIEKQFSRLDEAVANLKRIKANLKRFKAAVLKAAVDGKLTEDWRKTHPDVEPASKLLDRILTDRRAKWNGSEKYKEPGVPDSSNLPELPQNWTWCNLEPLVLSYQNGLSKRRSTSGTATNVLRLADIQTGRISSSSPRAILLLEAEIKKYLLRKGDLVCIRVNGSRDLVGKLIPFEGTEHWAYCDHFIRFRPIQGIVNTKFLSHVFNCDFVRDHFERTMVSTAGQHTVNQQALKATPIPFPPSVEQDQIVAEVERRLSVIDELEATVEANLTRAARLRQSVLQTAFSGKLNGPISVSGDKIA